MKILIIGAGSIGKRHLGNLQSLGIKQLGVFDTDKNKLTQIQQHFSGPIFASLQAAQKENWSAVFICSPTHTHLQFALQFAKTKTPMFIEKPLSHNTRYLAQLQKMCRDIKPIMVGYNIDFHPQLQKIKSILQKKALGKIYGCRAEFGYYLPDWREGVDYANTYSAKKEWGGGIVLDDIHEINLLYNLFGPVKQLFGWAKKQSDLKINVEDYAEMIFWFQNGIVGQIHMDYLQRDYSRYLKIIGEKGTLIWYLKEAKIDLYLAANKKWKTIDKITNFDWNITYLNETKEFLRCLQKRENPASDLKRAVQTLKIALAVKESSQKGKCLRVI